MTPEPDETTQNAPSFQVATLCDQHLPEAAELFAAGYRELRRRAASMPARYEDAGSILPKLQELAAEAPGVVAVRNGQLVGFMMGQVLSSFRGKPAAYSPEWAHAAAGPGRQDIYRAMYACISRHWIDDGLMTHLIPVLAHQQEVLDAFFRTEFGMMGVDAMRDLSRVEHAPSAYEVRQAGIEDTDAVMKLLTVLETHLAEAPIFLCDGGAPDRQSIEQRLTDPKRPSWLACDGQVPVGYMPIQPGNPDAAFIINDPKTVSIKAAVTSPDYRGRGVSALLLDRAIAWARSAGFERCSVDFEPQNIPGSRFWLKHFQPVCYSLIRHIDERLAMDREGESA